MKPFTYKRVGSPAEAIGGVRPRAGFTLHRGRYKARRHDEAAGRDAGAPWSMSRTRVGFRGSPPFGSGVRFLAFGYEAARRRLRVDDGVGIQL